MSLGSRIINGGKAAVVASLTSTPREPLLFLYPQFSRNASTRTAKPTFVNNGRALAAFTREYTAPAIGLPKPPFYTQDNALQNAISVESERDLPSDQIWKDSKLQIPTERESAIKSSQLFIQKAQKKRVSKPVEPQNGVREAFEKKIVKTVKIRKKAEKGALSKRRFRKVYQEVKREEKGSWIPDWRTILGELRKTTQWDHKWFDKAVSISVPVNADEKLLRGVDDNIWDISAKYDCSVTLGKPDEGTGLCNEFILSGSGMAISKTTADVIQIVPRAKIKTTHNKIFTASSKSIKDSPTYTDDEIGRSLRYVKAEANGKMRALRVDAIPKPTEWTVQSFAEYVDRLTSMQMPNHTHRLLYKKGEGHVTSVTKILRDVFTDPSCRSSLSRTAFKKALGYFVKTSSIADARAVFVLMDMTPIQMDPETFNILLRGAAKNEDLHNFHFVLHLMLRRGVSPNGGTWVAFMMANPDYRIRRYIVAEMREKGLLEHPAILRKVCQELAIREINTSLDRGQSQDEFFEHMGTQYGQDWLSVDTGNRILHALATRGIISRCWDFLQVMVTRLAKIDNISVNTILNHCKQQTNAIGAIELMRLLPSLIPYEPDSESYHALFEIAWRTRSYNLARVIWKYACLNAATTARMRMLVAQSMMNSSLAANAEMSQSKRWRQQAGFVISNDIFEHPMQSSMNRVGKIVKEPRSVPAISQAVSRNEMSEAVTNHLKREYTIFRQWKPARPFGDELMKAWELDRKWQRDRMHSAGGEKLDWKVQEAIPVLLLSRHSLGHEDSAMEWR